MAAQKQYFPVPKHWIRGPGWLHGAALHCVALHCIALHCTALHCAALHCTALHCTTFPLHCAASALRNQCTVPPLHCTAPLHCTHQPQRPCAALHCTTTSLHCTPLRLPLCHHFHCTALHCSALQSNCPPDCFSSVLFSATNPSTGHYTGIKCHTEGGHWIRGPDP